MKGGGVGLEVNFCDLRKVEDIAQTSEEVGEVLFGEQGRSAAPEINSAQGPMAKLAVTALGLFQQGINEDGKVRFAWGVFVEGTVGAYLVAKGEMEVETERCGHGWWSYEFVVVGYGL